MTKLYLDTSVLIPYLYQQREEPGQHRDMRDLFAAAYAGRVEVAISFYTLPELYNFARKIYTVEGVASAFREGMIALFGESLLVFPHLDRTEANRRRRGFTIADSYDALHVACALFHGCEAVVTYDFHFQTVVDVIAILTPEEALARLADSEAE